MSRNERNKGNKDSENFGLNILNNCSYALILDQNICNILWDYAISKEMT